MPSAKRQPYTGPSVRSTEALASLKLWLTTLTPSIRKRGEADYAQNLVTAVWSNADHLVQAEVDGKFIDEVTLFLKRGVWTSECSCPMGANCRHAVATACAWIGNQGRNLGTPAGDDALDDDDYEDALPAPGSKPAPPRKKLSFRDAWSPQIAVKLDPPELVISIRELSGCR